jgi:hypothetical protein
VVVIKGSIRIEKGLKEGDLVILPPETSLADGTRVSVKVAKGGE